MQTFIVFSPFKLAQAVGFVVQCRSGGQLATKLVDRYFVLSVTTFSHRMAHWIITLILRKLSGLPKSPFQIPLNHFRAPWRLFLILQNMWCYRR